MLEEVVGLCVDDWSFPAPGKLLYRRSEERRAARTAPARLNEDLHRPAIVASTAIVTSLIAQAFVSPFYDFLPLTASPHGGSHTTLYIARPSWVLCPHDESLRARDSFRSPDTLHWEILRVFYK